MRFQRFSVPGNEFAVVTWLGRDSGAFKGHLYDVVASRFEIVNLGATNGRSRVVPFQDDRFDSLPVNRPIHKIGSFRLMGQGIERSHELFHDFLQGDGLSTLPVEDQQTFG